MLVLSQTMQQISLSPHFDARSGFCCIFSQLIRVSDDSAFVTLYLPPFFITLFVVPRHAPFFRSVARLAPSYALFHLSWFHFRQIVPFSQDEQNKEPFVNFLVDSEVYDYDASVKPAFDTFSRMLSLFVECAAHIDIARSASPLSSSSSVPHSSSFATSSASAHACHPRPFSMDRNEEWPRMLEDALMKAHSWEDRETTESPHQPHSDAVSGVWLLLVLPNLVNTSFGAFVLVKMTIRQFDVLIWNAY